MYWSQKLERNVFRKSNMRLTCWTPISSSTAGRRRRAHGRFGWTSSPSDVGKDLNPPSPQPQLQAPARLHATDLRTGLPRLRWLVCWADHGAGWAPRAGSLLRGDRWPNREDSWPVSAKVTLLFCKSTHKSRFLTPRQPSYRSLKQSVLPKRYNSYLVFRYRDSWIWLSKKTRAWTFCNN